MNVHLVGADFEENLGLGVLAASVEAAGHDCRVLAFDHATDTSTLVDTVVQAAPDVVGLSIQFQHRAREFLELCRALRAAGYDGHVTAGGQFPTAAATEVLEGGWGLDSIVLHEGERTLPELVDAIAGGLPLEGVAGVVFRDAAGRLVRTAARPVADDLDDRPFPLRYRPHSKHVGVPFIPIMGSRGCWGECTFCSIAAHHRDARAAAGGKIFRLRSPKSIAAEMATLVRGAGGRAIFCFHDDNLLLPRPAQTLARLRDIVDELEELGGGQIALVGKCRPETLTRELAHALRRLGFIRLYVGVENVSTAGAAHLGRSVQRNAVTEALAACRAAGIFGCYNLLLFEPDATIADVRDNLRFIRSNPDLPVNFCRAEPYHGTPMHRRLLREQPLGGSYLGWNYRIADDATEALFRICSAAFRERNFAPNGLANRTMGVGYAAKVLEHFHGADPRVAPLVRRSAELTRRVSLDTASFLEEAIALVERHGPRSGDALERATALLGLDIARADESLHRAVDDFLADVAAVACAPACIAKPTGEPPRRRGVGRSVAVGLTLAVAWAGCDDESTAVVDQVPSDGGTTVVDPPPPDGGDGGATTTIVDPPPADAGDGGQGGMPADPPPADAGDGGQGGMPADPPPEDAGRAAVDQWVDTAVAALVRTRDLPLFDPPKFELEAEEVGDEVEVRVVGSLPRFTTRWEAASPVIGRGRAVRWRPEGPADRIRVAVRTEGGVAVQSLRASMVGRRRIG